MALEKYNREGLGLLNVHGLSTQREASDPHDHIHAFVDLMKKTQSPPADYRSSICQLYNVISSKLFPKMSSLATLRFATVKEDKNPFGLPSWVIDWSRR